MKKNILVGILFLFLILNISLVSSQLAYEITLSENEGILKLEQLNVIDIDPSDMAGQQIGEYMLVIGNKNTTNEYLDGTFLTLPTTVFITSIDEDGNLRTVEEHKNIATVHIPFNDAATKLDIYIDNGTKVLSRNLSSSEPSFETDSVLKNYTTPIEQNNSEKNTGIQQTISDKEGKDKQLQQIKVIILMSLLVLFMVLLLAIRKFRRRKNEL